MGEAMRRRQVQIEQIRKAVEAGEPPQPSQENPGEVLSGFLAMLKDYQDAGNEGISPVDAAAMVCQVLDLERWAYSMSQYHAMKDALTELDHRVVVPVTQRVQ